jgi:hypothetical protein
MDQVDRGQRYQSGGELMIRSASPATCTHDRLMLVADTPAPGLRMARELDRLLSSIDMTRLFRRLDGGIRKWRAGLGSSERNANARVRAFVRSLEAPAPDGPSS